MRKTLFILFIYFLLFISFINAQDTIKTDVSLDMLHAPSSPAFQILEVSDDKVERPGTPTDFWLSVKQATNDYSIIPKNYSLDFAPFWLFGGRSVSFNDLADKKDFLSIAKQTLGISIATNTQTDTAKKTEYRRLAIGLKFSIIRGNVSSEFRKTEELLDIVLKSWSDALAGLKEKDSTYNAILTKKKELLKAHNLVEAKKLNPLLEQREEILNRKASDQVDNDIKKTKEKLENNKLTRVGFSLDFACALGLDFPTNDFRLSYVRKFGAWLTGGYEGENKLSALALARIFVTPNQQLTNSSGSNDTVSLANFDYGARLSYDGIKNFSISGEILGRTFLKKDNTSKTETKYRYTLGIGYEIFKNKSLTFNVGKEFDTNPQFGGNLIAALNLVLGFGSDRLYKNK